MLSTSESWIITRHQPTSAENATSCVLRTAYALLLYLNAMALFVLEPLHKVARIGTGDDEWTWKGCFWGLRAPKRIWQKHFDKAVEELPCTDDVEAPKKLNLIYEDFPWTP